MANSEMARGLAIGGRSEEGLCEVCSVEKLTKLPFPSREGRAGAVGDLIHSDVVWKFEVETIGGKQYLVTFFIDDFSTYTTIYLVRTKDKVLDSSRMLTTSLDGYQRRSGQTTAGNTLPTNSNSSRFRRESNTKRPFPAIRSKTVSQSGRINGALYAEKAADYPSHSGEKRLQRQFSSRYVMLTRQA